MAELDWGLDCHLHQEVGPYTVSSIGRSRLTCFLDPMREMLFDCYPYDAAGETVVMKDGERYAAITYRSRDQAEEGHHTIVSLLEQGITDWLHPFSLANVRRWGYVRRGLIKLIQRGE